MNKGHRVSPRSTKDIRGLANLLRSEFNISSERFPIVELVEILAYQEEIEFIITSLEDMPDDYGLTLPKKNIIKLREDVYDDAARGGGFGRFTLAHELGHLLLHRREVVFARNQCTSNHKPFEDSEWQADKFAQELLVDVHHVNPYTTINTIADKFSITRRAAEVTFSALKKEGIIQQ